MTENEAIRILERDLKIQIENKCLPDGIEATKVAIKSMKEIQQYRSIGTVEEIKKVIQFLSLDNDNGIIEDLEELNKYKFIGTVEECREAVERQREKRYEIVKPYKSVSYYQCPACNTLFHINENFCGECGQAISWEESEG